MKLSNIKSVRKKKIISVTFLIIFFLSLLFIGLINFKLAILVFGIFLIIAILVFRVVINNLRFFEYENYGEVVTIRNHFLFKTKNHPTEFPKSKLLYFEINCVLRYPKLTMLQMTLSSRLRNKVCLRFIFSGLDRKDIEMLENSLRKIIGEKNVQ